MSCAYDGYVAPLRGDEHAAVQARLVRAPDLVDRAVDVAEDRARPRGPCAARGSASTARRTSGCRRGRPRARARDRGRRRSPGRRRTARPCSRWRRRGRGRSPRRRRRRCRAPCRAWARPSRSAAHPRAGSPRPPRGRTTPPGTRRRRPSSNGPRCSRICARSALALDERLVERVAVLRVEVRLVVGCLRSGVAVGRDDEVVVHHGAPVRQGVVQINRDAAGERGVDHVVAEAARARVTRGTAPCVSSAPPSMPMLCPVTHDDSGPAR